MLIMIQLDSLDTEIGQLRSQISGMKGKVAAAEKQKQNTQSVQDFLESDIDWLAELSQLSQRLPPADDVTLRLLASASVRELWMSILNGEAESGIYTFRAEQYINYG